MIKRFVKSKPVSEIDLDVKNLLISKPQEGLNILKMDIEGDEYEVLPTLNSGNKFDLLLLELHHFDDEIYKARLINILDWDNYFAYFVNVNNFSLGQYSTAGVIEIGLVKKSIFHKCVISQKQGGYASAMNTPKLNRVVEFSS